MADHLVMNEALAELHGLLEACRRRGTEWANRSMARPPNLELQATLAQLTADIRLLHDLLVPNERVTGVVDDLGRRIQEFLQANLDRGPTLKLLAAFLGCSEKYCSDLFRRRVGEPFSLYVKQLRVKTALRLLQERGVSVAQVATALGFSDQFAFSHFFKKAVGCSPNQFRQRCHGR